MDELRIFFKTHQIQLLKLVNSEAGKFVLNSGFPNQIDKITPVMIESSLEQGLKIANFYTGDFILRKILIPYQKILIAHSYKRIENLYEAFLHYQGFYPKPNKYPLILLTRTDPFYPGTGERTGRMAEPTWAATRDAVASEANSGITEMGTLRDAIQYYAYRVHEPWNTADLTSLARVASSKVRLFRDDAQEFGGNGFQNTEGVTAHIVVSTMPDPTLYSDADFDAITGWGSPTSKGSKAFASIGANNTYTDIDITDQSIIQRNGWTKLCLLTSQDLSNVAPSTISSINTFVWQNKSQANPPILSVTFTRQSGVAVFL